MLNWDERGGKLGSKGLLRELGSQRGAGVLSLMEHGAAEIQSFSTNMGEEKENREGGELPGLRDRVGTGTNTS